MRNNVNHFWKTKPVVISYQLLNPFSVFNYISQEGVKNRG